MTLTKQQHNILEIMLDLKKETTPNELENIYKSRHNEIGETSIYKQLERMVVDGLIKRIAHGRYSITEKCLFLLKKKERLREEYSISFSEKEVQEFLDFSKNKNCLEILAEMLNPALLGLNKERIASLIALVSLKDVYGDRNRVTVLLVGPPSVGKTQIIKWMCHFLWGFWVESDASKASLKGTGKGYQFSEGVLQKADNSCLFVDELDKMPKRDQESLLSSIEIGAIKVDKDRVDRETPARIRVIATCNNKSLIIEQLLNRFDIQLNVKKLEEEERNKLITKRTNDWNREKLSQMGPSFLKRYLIFTNQWETRLPEDREWLNNYLLRELKYGVLQKKDPRQIEAVYRIMLAIGRLKLHPEVTIEDLKDAFDLLE